MSEANIQQNTGSPNDEIDIFEFSSRMWKAFVSFLVGIRDLFISFIILLIRKSLWIISFAVAGFLLGYLIYGISRPTYSSSLEGNTGGLDNTVVVEHINKLNKLEGKPEFLANYLNITVEQAKDISSIKAFYGIDYNKDGIPDMVDFKEKYNPRDTNQMRLPSYIFLKVSVYDEKIFPDLRKGLLQYINSNNYLRDMFEINRAQKQKMIDEIDAEIRKIDSLQRARFRKDAYPNTQTVIVGTEPEIKLFHEDVLTLFTRRQYLERDLLISDEIIVVVQDFTPLSEEENPVSIYILIFGGAMSVMGFFCALLWQYRKRILELIREDSTNR